MIIGRSRDTAGVDETFNQIMIARGFVPEGPGTVLFSMRTLMRDSSLLNHVLKTGPYRKQALVPPSPWLDDTAPATPSAVVSSDTAVTRISWSHPAASDVFRYVAFAQYTNGWTYAVLNRNDRSTDFPLVLTVQERVRARRNRDSVRVRTESLQRVAISAVDRVGNESEKAFFDVAVPKNAATLPEPAIVPSP